MTNSFNFSTSIFDAKFPSAANGSQYFSSYFEYEPDEDAPAYWKSVANAQWIDITSTSWDIGDPCGDGQMAKIHRSLHKFFIFIKGIKKYGNLYINGTINKVRNLQTTIKAITGAIAGVLKTVIQRFRNWLLNHIKELIRYAMEDLLPNWAKELKQGVVAQILDQVFCGVKKIIKGLIDLVGDFLYALIGQVINAPFCAAEKWANALVNRLVSDIDKVLGPIFDQINDILGGVAKIFGSVSSAINKILGFQGFLCGEPNCPDIKEFKLGPWGGPSAAQVDAFNNFNFGISPEFADQITKGADDALDDFFGKDSKTAQSPGNCYTGSFDCGIPQIVLFGGGGSGAAAQVIVNKIGQVIGSNVLNSGSSYTSTPFVSIEDPAGCGNNASAFAVLGEGDDIGKVVDIKINNPGTGYNTPYIGGAPVINTFVGSPNPSVIGSTVVLSWDVSNADNISLNIPGYDGLPAVGAISLPIPLDTYFEPGETVTTKQYTLTAKKTNKNSSVQEVSKTFILTIKKSNADGEQPVNVNAPVIDSFTASPGTVKPGQIFTLAWNTSNVSNVSLLDMPGYETLPEDNSLSLVAPLELDFPSDGSNAELQYVLKATNKNAVGGVKSVTSLVKVFVSPVETGGTGTGTDDGLDDGSDADGSGTDGTGNTDGISVIGDIDIINTGIGYTSGDTINISDGSGSNIGFDINPSGQIVGLNVLDSGFGFTSIPTLTINSTTGLGAEFRVNLKFIPLNQFLKDQKLLESQIDPNKLVQVIDCITK